MQGKILQAYWRMAKNFNTAAGKIYRKGRAAALCEQALGRGCMEQGKGGALITLTGNRSAVVDGCDGIIDYDGEKILLRAGRLTVRFGGRDLALRRLTENSAVIEGFISQVEYMM